MTTQQHLSTMLQREAISSIQKIDDPAELARISDPQTGDFRSTVRAAASRRLRWLTKRGRPFRNPEEGRIRAHAVGMTDAMWAEVSAFAERECVETAEALRRLIRRGLDASGAG